MRDPAGEKQPGIRLSQIRRIELELSEKIARMIQGHQHHYQSAKQVYGFEAQTSRARWKFRETPRRRWLSGVGHSQDIQRFVLDRLASCNGIVPAERACEPI